jgi:hypothetical protein
MKKINLVLILAITVTAVANAQQSYTSFHPGELWLDNNGAPINAHGGGILYEKGTYYWFGEHKTEGKAGNRALVGVHVYSSNDLYNWKGEGYAGAMTGIAQAEKVTGPYHYIRMTRATPKMWPVDVLPLHKKPVEEQYKADIANLHGSEHPDSLNTLGRDFEKGQHSRDMTLFVDDDGKAYHICSSESNSTIHINQLTDDYLDFNGRYVRAFVGKRMEAPSFYHSQSTFFLQVQGTDQIIYMGDRWRPENAIDGRYVWLPVEWQDGRFVLRWQPEWKLDKNVNNTIE